MCTMLYALAFVCAFVAATGGKSNRPTVKRISESPKEKPDR